MTSWACKSYAKYSRQSYIVFHLKERLQTQSSLFDRWKTVLLTYTVHFPISVWLLFFSLLFTFSKFKNLHTTKSHVFGLQRLTSCIPDTDTLNVWTLCKTTILRNKRFFLHFTALWNLSKQLVFNSIHFLIFFKYNQYYIRTYINKIVAFPSFNAIKTLALNACSQEFSSNASVTSDLLYIYACIRKPHSITLKS